MITDWPYLTEKLLKGTFKSEHNSDHSFSGDVENLDNPIVLPVEGCILDDPPDELPVSVQDWASYYKYRGFRLDSPIAILLQFPLTIFHIVKYRLPNDCK